MVEKVTKTKLQKKNQPKCGERKVELGTHKYRVGGYNNQSRIKKQDRIGDTGQ